MRQLGAVQYDPGTAVNKATTALLAMTALDTTNARLTVTVPKSGRIMWKVQATLHGAATYPQVMLGVLDGSTVRARKAAMLAGGNLAATTICACWAEGTITGLTPGASITLDAAYGVETLVAATGLKYGGPNNTTANDNFGALSFELFDPDPYNVDASGNVQADVREWNTAAVPALVGGRLDCSVGAMANDVVTAAAVANGAIDAATFAAGAVDATAFAQGAADKVWGTAARTLTSGANIVLAKGVGVTGFNDLDAAGVRGAVGLAAANLDTQLTSIETKVDGVKAKTDALTFSVAGKLDVNVLVVNGITVIGAGTPASPWGPAP